MPSLLLQSAPHCHQLPQSVANLFKVTASHNLRMGTSKQGQPYLVGHQAGERLGWCGSVKDFHTRKSKMWNWCFGSVVHLPNGSIMLAVSLFEVYDVSLEQNVAFSQSVCQSYFYCRLFSTGHFLIRDHIHLITQANWGFRGFFVAKTICDLFKKMISFSFFLYLMQSVTYLHHTFRLF